MSTGNSIIIAAFTRRGIDTAKKIGGRVFVPERLACQGVEIISGSLSEWAGKFFHERALIFVGACGIAIRAIAPHVKSKLADPAVIVIDEAGKFIIPVLSGHVGGANELALNIAKILHGQAIITTATDVNNIPAIDEWAIKNNCNIENPERIKNISGVLLENNSVGVAITEKILCPPFPVTLWLRPRNLFLGVGCNRGVDVKFFDDCAKNFLSGAGVSELSLAGVASINLKKDEAAINSFVKKNNIPFLTFSASELQALLGEFSRSQKVFDAVGTNNVCERSCVLAAGENAVLLRSKTSYSGQITFALARMRGK